MPGGRFSSLESSTGTRLTTGEMRHKISLTTTPVAFLVNTLAAQTKAMAFIDRELPRLLPGLQEARCISWDRLNMELQENLRKFGSESGQYFLIEADFDQDGVDEVAMAGRYKRYKEDRSSRFPFETSDHYYNQASRTDRGSFVLLPE